MSQSRYYNRKNIGILSILYALALSATVFLFLFLSAPGNRGEMFQITFGWTLALETLIYAYLTSLFIPMDWHAPMRFALGTTLSSYVVLASLTMLTFNLANTSLPIKMYIASLVVESILYVLLTGRFIIINSLRQTDTHRSGAEKDVVKQWLLQIDQAVTEISTNRTINQEEKNSLLREFARLREGLQFSPPYGAVRAGNETLRDGIEENLRKLVESVAQIDDVRPKIASESLRNLQKSLAMLRRNLVR